MDINANPPRRGAPLTLAIDIGGTRLKVGLLDISGNLVGGPNRVDTPARPAPQTVVEALVTLATPLEPFDRISIGFPGVVRHGQVLTAPNLGTDDWRHFPLVAALTDKLGKPGRMLNDSEVQGLGVIAGKGLECVITLGTGMGFSLFQDGHPAPHLELSQHPIRKGKTYDEYIGAAAFKEIGRKKWNRRVKRALGWIETLVNYETLYIGGGNAKHLALNLPDNVHLVSNEAGITGGVRLWDHRLDEVFANGG